MEEAAIIHSKYFKKLQRYRYTIASLCTLLSPVALGNSTTPSDFEHGVFLFPAGEVSSILDTYDGITLRVGSNKSPSQSDTIVLKKNWRNFLSQANSQFETNSSTKDFLVSNFPYTITTEKSKFDETFVILQLSQGKSDTLCVSSQGALKSQSRNQLISLDCNHSFQININYKSISKSRNAKKDHFALGQASTHKINADWYKRARFGYLNSKSETIEILRATKQEKDKLELEIFASKDQKQLGQIDLSVAIRDPRSEANVFESKLTASNEAIHELLVQEKALALDGTFLAGNFASSLGSISKREQVSASLSIHWSSLEIKDLEAGCSNAKSTIASLSITINSIHESFTQDFPVNLGQELNCQNQKSISIGSYNIENLWDDDPNNSKPYNDYSSQGSNWYKENIYKYKAEKVANAIAIAGSPTILGATGNGKRSKQ